MDLTITETVETGRHLMQVAGALDLTSRDQLLQEGRAALSLTETTELVVELSGVDFIDSSGIGAIVSLAGDAEDCGRSFALQAPSARVTRVLEIAGLLDAWTIIDGPS